jgi:hypothetical protein
MQEKESTLARHTERTKFFATGKSLSGGLFGGITLILFKMRQINNCLLSGSGLGSVEFSL